MELIVLGEGLVLLAVLTIVGSYIALIHQWLKDPDRGEGGVRCRAMPAFPPVPPRSGRQCSGELAPSASARARRA